MSFFLSSLMSPPSTLVYSFLSFFSSSDPSSLLSLLPILVHDLLPSCLYSFSFFLYSLPCSFPPSHYACPVNILEEKDEAVATRSKKYATKIKTLTTSWLNSQPFPSYLQNPWITILRQVLALLLLVNDTAMFCIHEQVFMGGMIRSFCV